MRKSEIIDAIEFLKKYKTETTELEVKTASSDFPKKCYDTISSFSNKHGGIIIFGINEDNNFSIDGVYNLNDLQKHITSLCSNAMEPSIRCDLLPLEYENKNLLAVKIDELEENKKPCYYKPKGLKGGSYTRIGDRDEVMTDYEIYAIKSYNDRIIEDLRPNKRGTIEDLNNDLINEYLEKIKETKPRFSKMTKENQLKTCGIIDKNNSEVFPTLAGTMLFGEWPQAYYPQLFVACVVIPGIDIGERGPNNERFLANKRVDGTIEEMLEGTLNFLKRNMRVSVTIDEQGKRTDKTEYPIDALKEAITNALIHRDYSFQSEGAYISVYMYNDRLEIISPGALYGTNSIEKLGTSTRMESRNPTIIKILEEKGNIIENRHTGIKTMKEEMEKYNLPEPEFYNERDCFKVIFRNNFSRLEKFGTKEIDDHGTGHETGHETGQVINNDNKLQNKVIEYCKEAKTAKEIREYLKIKSRQYVSTYIIGPLIKSGKLEYVNKNNPKDRNQKYITTK